MSSGTTSGSNPARHTRRHWLAAGWAATTRLLGLYGLLLAGAALLLALLMPVAISALLIIRVLKQHSQAVAAPGPALDPEDPSSKSHGFMVWPPNQISLSASAPRLSFATSTAPASLSRFTTTAFSTGTRLRNGSAP